MARCRTRDRRPDRSPVSDPSAWRRPPEFVDALGNAGNLREHGVRDSGEIERHHGELLAGLHHLVPGRLAFAGGVAEQGSREPGEGVH